ncbi:MAG TPA: response regulator transcription factor [Acidimicrobiales bacterium]|nr:response regulator transcription factor [Acidimicrobiales bacterium]
MARVLLVEDDADIAEPLSRALRADHDVTVASTGRGALDALAEREVDIVVLDLGLPDIDGLEVCRRIRREHGDLPVLMLTARGEELDVVVGLDSGADDYVAKPFRAAELLARVRALVRRAPATRVYDANGVHVDESSRRAWVGDEELTLTPKEFDLLALLVREAGTVISRDRIMTEVWDENWWGPTKTLDMHVSWLRKKLGDDPSAPRYITTIRGVGLRFERR